MGTGWKCFKAHDRESHGCHEETVDKSMDVQHCSQ